MTVYIIVGNEYLFSDSLPLVTNQLETALTDAADSADLDEGAENENFISNVLQKVFMDSKFDDQGLDSRLSKFRNSKVFLELIDLVHFTL